MGIVIGDAIDKNIAILTTTDGGAHWTRVPSASLPPAMPTEGSFAASGTCLVTKPGGHAWIVSSNPDHGRVLHTANFGKTWSVDTLPITTRGGVGPQSIGFRDARNGIRVRWRQRGAGRRQVHRNNERRRPHLDAANESTARDRSLGRRVRPRRGQADRRSGRTSRRGRVA